MPEKDKKFRQFKSFALTLTMYLLSATGCSNFPKIKLIGERLQRLIRHEIPSRNDIVRSHGMPSDHLAFGSIRKRKVD